MSIKNLWLLGGKWKCSGPDMPWQTNKCWSSSFSLWWTIWFGAKSGPHCSYKWASGIAWPGLTRMPTVRTVSIARFGRNSCSHTLEMPKKYFVGSDPGCIFLVVSIAFKQSLRLLLLALFLSLLYQLLVILELILQILVNISLFPPVFIMFLRFSKNCRKVVSIDSIDENRWTSIKTEEQRQRCGQKWCNMTPNMTNTIIQIKYLQLANGNKHADCKTNGKAMTIKVTVGKYKTSDHKNINKSENTSENKSSWLGRLLMGREEHR